MTAFVFSRVLCLQRFSHSVMLWDCSHIQLIKVASRDKSGLKLKKVCILALSEMKEYFPFLLIACFAISFKAFVVVGGDK